jgi:hypothetical protein
MLHPEVMPTFVEVDVGVSRLTSSISQINRLIASRATYSRHSSHNAGMLHHCQFGDIFILILVVATWSICSHRGLGAATNSTNDTPDRFL